MNQQRPPVCWIIAGPNGAGKTTFALNYLPRVANCHVFVNADLIAAGLAPLAPKGKAIAASRVFLKEISLNIGARRDFGFETTLAGKGYLNLIKRLRTDGWRLELIYLALPNIELALNRVAERVLHGGHDIPKKDVERRFPRSLENFLGEYANLVDRAVCYYNAGSEPVLIFTQRQAQRVVSEPELLRKLEEQKSNVIA